MLERLINKIEEREQKKKRVVLDAVEEWHEFLPSWKRIDVRGATSSDVRKTIVEMTGHTPRKRSLERTLKLMAQERILISGYALIWKKGGFVDKPHYRVPLRRDLAIFQDRAKDPARL